MCAINSSMSLSMLAKRLSTIGNPLIGTHRSQLRWIEIVNSDESGPSAQHKNIGSWIDRAAIRAGR